MKLATITLTKFDLTTKHYSDWDTDHTHYYHFKRIENSTFTIYVEAETLMDADNWLLNNLPEYYCGSTIVMNNGESVIINAVPHYYYQEFTRFTGREPQSYEEVIDFIKNS